jgi:hypothetical protein
MAVLGSGGSALVVVGVGISCTRDDSVKERAAGQSSAASGLRVCILQIWAGDDSRVMRVAAMSHTAAFGQNHKYKSWTPQEEQAASNTRAGG